MSRWPADRYDKPIGTPITDETLTRAEARRAEYLAGQDAQRADNIDPEARARRAENILPDVETMPPVEQFDPAIRYSGRLTPEQIQTIREKLEERGIDQGLFVWPDDGPEPKHLIASRITHERIVALVQARYGAEVSSIAIAFKDGTKDYIVPPAE